KTEARRTLLVDPSNSEASDLLATIDMSVGEVQSALRVWNKSGRPIVDDILHNYYLSFGSWVVRKAVAFHPSGVLRYSEWKTTEARLLETDNFGNVDLEIEPTTIPDQYNAVVRTNTKTNDLLGVARFKYDANILRLHVKQIPHYRFDIGGGIEYRNRSASGNLPKLATDSRNVGKFSVESNLRLFDGQYQNRLHLEGFAARRSI